MVSSAQLLHTALRAAARRIGDYMDYTVYPKNETKLADLYIKTKEKDAYMAEGYLAALMLRHWKDINKLYESTKSVAFTLDRDDFTTKIYERIEYACKYAGWKENPKLTAQQCINRSIATEVKNLFYFSNRDKYKANFNVISLDAPISSSTDKNEPADLVNFIPDSLSFSESFDLKAASIGSYVNSSTSKADGSEIIQDFIDKNKIVEAIILDNIANGDCFKESSRKESITNRETGEKMKITKFNTEFKSYKLVKVLNSLTSNYFDYFISKYTVKPEVARIALSSIQSANNTKLYKFIDNTLLGARQTLSTRYWKEIN